MRERDGLALSSRNVRLSPEERRAAVVLSRALAEGRALLAQGVEYSSSVAEAMRRVVESEPLVRLDYAVAVGQEDLVAREVIEDPASVRLLIAAEVGTGPAHRQLCRGRGGAPTAGRPTCRTTPLGTDRLTSAAPHDEVEDP